MSADAPDNIARKQTPEIDVINRLHAEIERNLYAAEITCMKREGINPFADDCCKGCHFMREQLGCPLPDLRAIIGKTPADRLQGSKAI